MGYYAKEDLLLRDEPGTTDGSLEVWSDVRKVWGIFPDLKRHFKQNVLVPISDKEAEAMKKAGWGPSQPAAALRPKE